MPKSRIGEASTSANTLDSKPAPKARSDGKGGQKPRKGKAPYPVKKPAAEGEVGASKIKAALRQTRRLLAKPNLAQDVRQEAQRRLLSLQSDLAKRESSQKERKNADRYHKVRFFERQKLVRQIKKIKKDRKGKGADDDDEELKEKRVLLNYVLNFPPSLKYVALFPSSGESPLIKPAQPAEETDVSRRAKQAYERAMDVRKKIIAAMERGELSTEPEVELDRRAGDEAPAKRARLDLDSDRKKSQSGRQATKKANKAEEEEEKSDAGGGIDGDDFFASDSDGE
ncbi:hypothetical protein BDZ90DRAFT_229524 [Jaminaea rosea]|uniref:rRNA-processing protein EFG1 n=1 Tax=Jaminaea rosea TaxID=1569628 RepID=A0A316UYZ3_9BASI|nr:hypothetical protein BDZ90DRAFT_229524 [Jaminaea rosea]PWN30509.1 hypothetical protein BDZ90DRAFT_229524 [Jaminaea rosea]